MTKTIAKMERNMSVSERAKFSGEFPHFQMPRSVGHYSLDGKRRYRKDTSRLRFLSLPKHYNGECQVSFDLRRGLSDVIEKDEDMVRESMLDDVLHWVLDERNSSKSFVVNVSSPLKPLAPEFVCFRGLLTKVMITPYENKESWKIVASKLHDTIYLWKIEEVVSIGHNLRRDEMTLWGFKFEQYLCSDSPGKLANPDSQLDLNEEFCCIVKTRLGRHSLLYGAEVDALKPEAKLPPWEDLKGFVELKTTKHMDTERQRSNFCKFKLLKWWAQSFLVGIPTIICGYRDDSGRVSKLKTHQVHELPAMSKEHWSANVCMNFCNEFLEFVRRSIPKSDPNIHYAFTYNARNQMISVDLCEDMQRPLLPHWYVDKMTNVQESHN